MFESLKVNSSGSVQKQILNKQKTNNIKLLKCSFNKELPKFWIICSKFPQWGIWDQKIASDKSKVSI